MICRRILIWLFSLGSILIIYQESRAQCAICTKTAQQLGEKPAKALNAGIIYLAIAPLAIFSYIGYRWWKANGADNQDS
jgi:hypothetical protein